MQANHQPPNENKHVPFNWPVAISILVGTALACVLNWADQPSAMAFIVPLICGAILVVAIGFDWPYFSSQTPTARLVWGCLPVVAIMLKISLGLWEVHEKHENFAAPQIDASRPFPLTEKESDELLQEIIRRRVAKESGSETQSVQILRPDRERLLQAEPE